MLDRLPPLPANATEVLRVWAQDDGQLVVALIPSWEEPEAWGVVLADVARHVARAHHQTTGTAQQGTLEAPAGCSRPKWPIPRTSRKPAS
jgi:hypothetical protein